MKTVIFDLDGTLVYQPPGVILKSNVRVVDFLAPDYPDPVGIVKAVYAETTENGGLIATKAEQIQCMAEKLSIIIDEDRIKEGLDIFLGSYIPPLTLHDDCLSTLQKLQANGIRMGIATNGAHDVQPHTIGKFELGKYFDFIVISSELKVSKDTKKFCRYLIENYDVNPDETLVIGDTLPDFLLAKCLQCKVYIVDREENVNFKSQRDSIISNMSEQQSLSGRQKVDEIPIDIIIPSLSLIPEIITKND